MFIQESSSGNRGEVEDDRMAHLLDLPYEVLGTIMKEVDPLDLAHLLETCKDLNQFISSQPLLYKNIYQRIWVRQRSPLNDRTSSLTKARTSTRRSEAR